MTKKITTLSILFFIAVSTFGQSKITADQLKKHVYYLASDELEGRGLATESGMKAASYIAEYFKKTGLEPVGDSYFHHFNARVGQSMLEGRNVVGMVEGSDPILKNEFIVLGAHFDHISFKIIDGKKIVYNGADDNASGTAAIMEIGRLLASKEVKLKRSVILVGFDGEESGLIGSGKFVMQNTVPISQIKAMMSIDMIGRYAESNSLVMGAMNNLIGGTEELIKIATKHGVKIKKTGGDVSNRTDTQPFGIAGIPAIYVSSGIVGPYHKPEDDASTLDYEGMELISNMLCDLTIALANQENLEAKSKFAKLAGNKGLPFFRIGAKSNIGGSAHTYPNEYYKGKSKFSSELGLMTQIKITKNIAIQPEVLYSTMGSKYTSGNFRTHSITTPLNLLIASKMQQLASQRFYATVGGYYTYHFAGSANKQALDFGNEYSQTETGLTYGLGLEAMSVFLSINFKHGLSNIFLHENTGKIRTRAFYISLGYMF